MYKMFGNYSIILASLIVVRSAKILVVAPFPAPSHQIVFRTIIQALVKRNHDVTAITTEEVFPGGGSPNNFIEINTKDIVDALMLNASKHASKSDKSNLIIIKETFPFLVNMFLAQLKQTSVLKLIRNKKTTFDLLIVEASLPGALVYSHIFKTPTIFLSTSGAYPRNMEMIGSETHPLLFPTQFQQKIYNLTNWEKMWELYIDVAFNALHHQVELDYDKELKVFFGKDTPVLCDLKNNVDFLFLNIHPIWVHNQAVPSNVVYIWGVHKTSEKVLPEELMSYLDSSEHGVIYVSFGTIYKTSEMRPQILQTFLKVFSRLPYNILWKWDEDELPGKSDNIKISKWFPQSDILRHPKLKLFITHGGLLSTGEAINAVVPLIGVPQFADQHYNSEKYEYFKIGIKLDYKSVTTENLEKAINTILADYNSYKTNILKLRTVMQDQQTPALERAVWRVEYVLRHGSALHLRAPAANMSWPQYYELDVVLTLLAGLILLATLFLVTLYTCLLIMLRFVTYKVRQPAESSKYK